jgi:hypothetical protein
MRHKRTSPPPLIERIFRPATLMLLACAAGSVVLTPWFLQQLPDLQTRPEYQLAFDRIELSRAPHDHVPTDLLRQIQRQHEFPEQVSILDETLVNRLAAACAAHPWIESVSEVRTTYPPRIVIQLNYRRPACLVGLKSGWYPVDPEGVLLPPSDFSAADAERYPVVRNVRSVPAGPAGKSWGDPVVLAGARLAETLRADWPELQLAAIVAPKPSSAKVDPADLIFSLSAKGGSRIVWGRAPGSGHPGELTAAQKIGRLQKYLQEFGGFDQPRGPYEIDIRHWQEISRRPLDPRHIQAGMNERLPLR